MQETATMHMNGATRRDIIDDLTKWFDELFGKGKWEFEEIAYEPGARGLDSGVIWWEGRAMVRRTSSTGGFRQ